MVLTRAVRLLLGPDVRAIRHLPGCCVLNCSFWDHAPASPREFPCRRTISRKGTRYVAGGAASVAARSGSCKGIVMRCSPFYGAVRRGWRPV